METIIHPPITVSLATQLIAEQFPEYAHLVVVPVEKQGHDNRTYRLGNDLLIRMPTAAPYALKVPKEQELLLQLAPSLSIKIPVPLKMGMPSQLYPFHFSIYQWLEGISINLLTLDDRAQQHLAYDLARFLKELQNIKNVKGLLPGQHNWWRGDHILVYEKNFQEQIKQLSQVIDCDKALSLWNKACNTTWDKDPVWVHGDIAVGNLLIKDGVLNAVIDFGGTAVGDPASDLVVAWTYFKDEAREIFIKQMNLDDNTWLRTKTWALWKATYELCQIKDFDSDEALLQKRIINEVFKHFIQ